MKYFYPVAYHKLSAIYIIFKSRCKFVERLVLLQVKSRVLSGNFCLFNEYTRTLKYFLFILQMSFSLFLNEC